MKQISLIIGMLICFCSKGQNCASVSSFWNTSGQNLNNLNNKLGSCNNFDVILKTNDTSRIFLKANGRVGINTDQPSSALTIKANYSDGFKIISSDSSGKMFSGINEKTNKETFLVFGTGKAFFGRQQIISTHPHANSFMQVAGKIACKELVVVDPSKWADFVFSNNYRLLPLSEVESFYKLNKHLPDVPSEKEIKENGINTAEMDAILLQKIEELTLYIVELSKKVEVLQKENSILKRNKKL